MVLNQKSAIIESIDMTGGEMTVRFNSEVTLDQIGETPQIVASAIRASTPEHVVLDLTEVGFLDSAGLALIVGVYRMPSVGDRLLVRSRHGSQPDRVLELSALNKLFTIQTEP